MNIFLADDDEDDRIFNADALAEITSQTDITEFTNGVELMAELHSERPLPDIIFLDLNMPLMDGFECLSDIREIEEFSKIPVVIYSTSFHEKDVEKLREMGATLYLQKPSSYDQLKKLLKKCLDDISTMESGMEITEIDSFVVE